MKKLCIAVPLMGMLFFNTSCKKPNENLIVGLWEMSDIWIDNEEAKTQYADMIQFPCNDSVTISYQPYYEVDLYTWNFEENTNFTWTELGTSYNLNPNACYGDATLVPSDNNTIIETSWAIDEKGKGENITLTAEGGYIDVKIKELTKEKLEVEFEMPDSDIKMRVIFKKR